MPLTIPPFSQFQGQLVPLRGLWNVRPPEGDYFINSEIDWGTANTQAVQFNVSGNSPVALSQIVALYVDNRRCGVDADFLFPDSGFLLTVPAHAQGLFPVLTNALMFYVIGALSAVGDVTVLQILNSLPPPIPLLPSSAQNSSAVAGIAVATGTTALVPAPISGTLNTLSLSLALASTGGNVTLSLQDGTGSLLWANGYTMIAGATLEMPIDLTGLSVRFRNGLNFVIFGLAGITGAVDANVYYVTP